MNDALVPQRRQMLTEGFRDPGIGGAYDRNNESGPLRTDATVSPDRRAAVGSNDHMWNVDTDAPI